MFGYLVFTTITIGGFAFGLANMSYMDELPACDLNSIDSATMDEVGGFFAKILTIESCYENLPEVFNRLDYNNNGLIERCEEA